MSKYQNKYRIKTTRLSNWDYSNPSMYFVTICTKNFANYFGIVSNDSVKLSSIGKIVQKEWLKTEQLRNNIKLDEYIIMPNHIHGIISIVETHGYASPLKITKTQSNLSPLQIAETHSNASLPTNEKSKNVFGPQINNLSSIIRGFKSACTKRIRTTLNPDFTWQPRFYDHIIRDENSLGNIQNYIINNPANWSFHTSIFEEDNLFFKSHKKSTRRTT